MLKYPNCEQFDKLKRDHILNKEISIVIPAFNEEASLEALVNNLKDVLPTNKSYEIIVVDDGSTDNTALIAKNISGVKTIRHPYNKGNGASVKAGIREATGEKIVIIDADGQHDPKYIPEMIILLDEYDLIVGARNSFGFGRRGFGNALVSRLASYLAGISIPDLTSGYRAFKKNKILEFLHLLPNRYSLPSTSTLAFATAGYNLKFIPIYPRERSGGTSSIKVTSDGVKFIVLIVRMISLFKPLKVFVPASILFLLTGLLWSAKTYYFTSGISSIGAMLILAGILTFLFGLMADQMAETRISLGKILSADLMKENKE